MFDGRYRREGAAAVGLLWFRRSGGVVGLGGLCLYRLAVAVEGWRRWRGSWWRWVVCDRLRCGGNFGWGKWAGKFYETL